MDRNRSDRASAVAASMDGNIDAATQKQQEDSADLKRPSMVKLLEMRAMDLEKPDMTLHTNLEATSKDNKDMGMVSHKNHSLSEVLWEEKLKGLESRTGMLEVILATLKSQTTAKLETMEGESRRHSAELQDLRTILASQETQRMKRNEQLSHNSIGAPHNDGNPILISFASTTGGTATTTGGDSNPSDPLIAPVQSDTATSIRSNLDGTASQPESDETPELLLPEDTYSFLALGRPCSWSFLCAVFVLVLQAVTFYFLLRPDTRESGNIFQVPANVTIGVRVCQVLAIIIAVINEDNFLGSLNTWSFGFSQVTLQEANFPLTSQKWWNLSCVLRLLEGVLALIATAILIMQTEAARDVLLNFTAVRFVSFLDNVVFTLGEFGSWGHLIQEDVRKIKEAVTTRRGNGSLRAMYLPLVLPVVLGFWFWIALYQENGDYLCHRIFVQFGDDSGKGDLSGFSGTYGMRRVGSWGDRVEYWEEPKVMIDGELTASAYSPAKFGYCADVGAWVFAHGNDAQSSPDLCKWNIRSAQSESYDIVSTAGQWYAKVGTVNVQMSFFSLECADCKKKDEKEHCGDHGSCPDSQCVCDDGWFGFRCQTTSPCEKLSYVVRTNKIPWYDTPDRLLAFPLEWDRGNEIDKSIVVYNRPAIRGPKFFQGGEWILYFMLFTGRQWKFVRQTSATGQINLGSLMQNFHACWSTYEVVFVSEGPHGGAITESATPKDLQWFYANNTQKTPLESLLGCVHPLTDDDIRLALSRRTVDNYHTLGTYGKIKEWNTSQVTDMSTLFRSMLEVPSKIRKWDTSNVVNMSRMFQGAEKFNLDLYEWDVSSVLDFSGMFETTVSFNGRVSTWDTSSATSMSGMFQRARRFDQDISSWNMSSVNQTSYMFSGAAAYNKDLSGWDVSSVMDMSFMFAGASSFNHDISMWNTSLVQNMDSMFAKASSFNQDISMWDTSLVQSMQFMFAGASSFNQEISMWNTSLVQYMWFMFRGASSFNQDISKWDTSLVSYMSFMFAGASSFNRDISKWKTSLVESMSSMFEGASSFNHDISDWNTSLVWHMGSMFKEASSFNQDISDWNTSSVGHMSSMFEGATEFNQDLSQWDTSHVNEMQRMFWNASSFNQELCWQLDKNVKVQGMFCGSRGKFNSSCVKKRLVKDSRRGCKQLRNWKG